MSKLCDSCVGDKLNAAVDFCADHGLYFNYVNENCKEVVEQFGTESRKIFAHEYIDDRSSCKQYGLPFKAYDCSKCHLPECQKVTNKRKPLPIGVNPKISPNYPQISGTNMISLDPMQPIRQEIYSMSRVTKEMFGYVDKLPDPPPLFLSRMMNVLNKEDKK